MSDGLWDALPDDAGRTNQQLSHLRWEATIVSRLLAFYDRKQLAPGLKQRCYDATGASRLLFCWFHDYYPSFPVWLGFRKVRYLHKWAMEDFMDRFSKSPAWEAYAVAKDDMPEHVVDAGLPFGLVFEYIHGMGAAIMTPCERPFGENNTRIVKNFRGVNYYFEPLNEFLEGLRWFPQD